MWVVRGLCCGAGVGEAPFVAPEARRPPDRDAAASFVCPREVISQAKNGSCVSASGQGAQCCPELEHVPPQLNRGILVRRRMGESIGTDSLLGAGRCRGLIPGTCVSE